MKELKVSSRSRELRSFDEMRYEKVFDKSFILTYPVMDFVI